MLRFFRFNDPYRLLFVAITVIVLGVKAQLENSEITLPELNGVLVGEMMANGKSMYSEVWHSMPPVTAFVEYLHDLTFDRSLLPRHVTSIILIIFQAALFGIILISNRAFNESNYLPSFVFAILAFFSFDTIGLTGEIMGSSLLLLAINNLLQEIEFKRQQDETIHNLGFYLGLASLSVFSYSVFFIGTAVLLFVFTRVEIRRLGLYIIGFLLPHLILNLWYFWNDSLDLLWANFYGVGFDSNALINTKSLFLLGGIPLVYFFFSLVMMRRDAHLTRYQSQIAQVMFFWLLIALIEIFLSKERTPQTLLVCVPPFAYFISHYFLLIRRKWIAETMLWIFFIGIISIGSLSARQKIEFIDFKALYVQKPKESFPGKKVLVMDDDISLYMNNQTSAFFLDWGLYQVVFKEPDVYQHVLLVANAFEKDPPDIIIDPGNNFKSILQYIPQVREKYSRAGTTYVRLP